MRTASQGSLNTGSEARRRETILEHASCDGHALHPKAFESEVASGDLLSAEGDVGGCRKGEDEAGEHSAGGERGVGAVAGDP
jgi:hypothetical protein